jgi:hypothetical protein
MKGQFFIIAAVIMILTLILLKNSFGIFDTLSEKRFVESSSENKQLKNILSEYRYILGIASLQSSPNVSAANYMSNFSSFLRNDRNIEILYAVAYIDDSTNTYTVTVGNYVGDRLNVTLNVTGSTPVSVNFTVNDRQNVTMNFSASVNNVINITMIHRRIDTLTTERFSIDSRRNMTMGFFDITLTDDTKIRIKDIYDVHVT